MASSLEEAPAPTPSGPARERAHRTVHVVRATGAAIVVGFLVVAHLTTPEFLTWTNMLTVLRTAAPVGIAAVGLAFITISGNYFSLSIEQTATFAAVIFGVCLVDAGMGLVPALTLALLAAAVTGVLQGLIVGLGANPIITTLGAGAGLIGLVSVITGTGTITIATNMTSALGSSTLGIPRVSYVFVALTALTYVILVKTRLGRSIVLVGANKAAATSAGIRSSRAVTGAFVICALTAATAGIFSAALFGEAGTQLMRGFTIDVVAAVLVSGISLRGGDGSPLRAAIGAFFIALLVNFAALHGYPYGVRLAMVGAAIVLGVTAHHLLKRARD
jgi:ribose transport system permease protein